MFVCNTFEIEIKSFFKFSKISLFCLIPWLIHSIICLCRWFVVRVSQNWRFPHGNICPHCKQNPDGTCLSSVMAMVLLTYIMYIVLHWSVVSSPHHNVLTHDVYIRYYYGDGFEFCVWICISPYFWIALCHLYTHARLSGLFRTRSILILLYQWAQKLVFPQSGRRISRFPTLILYSNEWKQNWSNE